MCRERKRTRDRLLEYNPMIIPPRPHTAGLAMIYPWENSSLSILQHQLFLIAQNNGFEGEESEFLDRFVHGGKGGVNVGTINTFPIPGVEDQLYLDTGTEILYYFKIAPDGISAEIADKIGAEVVGRAEDNSIYVYIPVRALPIEPLLLDCGSSTESID